MTVRLPDWPERLAAYVESRRSMPFAWGANDCVTFAAGAIHATTGRPLATLLPAVWSNADQAARALAAAGDMLAAVTRALGRPWPAWRAVHAPRGAVVAADQPDGLTLGVSMGNRHWCGPGRTGLVWRPMVEVRLAWPLE